SNSNRSELKFGKGPLDYRARALCETVFAQLVLRNPSRLAHVAGGLQVPTDYSAQIIDQNIVVFRLTFRIRNDPLEDLEHGKRLYLQARFFHHLATNGAVELLAQLEKSSGQGPEALERLFPSLH